MGKIRRHMTNQHLRRWSDFEHLSTEEKSSVLNLQVGIVMQATPRRSMVQEQPEGALSVLVEYFSSWCLLPKPQMAMRISRFSGLSTALTKSWHKQTKHSSTFSTPPTKTNAAKSFKACTKQAPAQLVQYLYVNASSDNRL